VSALLVTANTFAGSAKYDEGKIYTHKLDNGLKVLTIERHFSPTIYQQLTYRVGSRNERLGITGISHVVEHMMFKGTPKYSKGRISALISENSGVFNAFTMNDMTSYYEFMPKNKIMLAMDIESERMQNCMFNGDEFKSELKVIKQERRMRTESQANGVFGEIMNSVAYKSSPNRDPVIGWPGDLDHVTRDEAFTYYKTYYTPNNAFLVLVGDFDTEKMLDSVKKYYGRIPKGPDVQELWVKEEEQNVKMTFTLKRNDITSPSFRMAFHIPVYTDADAPALRIAQMILCEKSRDARLYKRLVEKEQISNMAAGGFGLTKDPGLFSISVSLFPDSSVERAEQIVWEEIAKMQNEPVTDNELQKVFNRYTFNELTGSIKNADIGTKINRYETYFGYELMDSFYQKALKTTKDDIMRVMQKYFQPDKVTIGYMFPKDPSKVKKDKNGVDIEDNDLNGDKQDKEDLLNVLQPDAFYYKMPSEVAGFLSSLTPDDFNEVIKPQPVKPMIKTFKLDNGITLNTIENHLAPAITIVGSFESCNVIEANEGGQPGICTVLADLMNRGTEKDDYKALSERMAYVPFQFGISGGYHGFAFQGYSLIKDSDEMMKTGFDLVTKPGLREDELSKIKVKQKISAKNRFKQTGMKAFYYMYNQIYKDHPYSKVNSTVESIESIKKEDLINLHKKYFIPEHLTLLMVGDMKPEEMRDIANKYYGAWKSDAKAGEIVKFPAPKGLDKKEIRVFPEKDYTQCTINIGFNPRADVDDNETEAVSIMNNILAQSALTSRMGVELRDKQGLFYGLKSELWAPADNIGYWKMNTKTAPKNTEKAIRGIFNEIKKFIKEGPTDEELAKAKGRALGLLPLIIETPDDVAGVVYDMMKDKKSFDFFDKKADRILAVTKDDVIRVAKKYFTLDKFIIVVDGPIEEKSLDGLADQL
jgi:zinc protease